MKLQSGEEIRLSILLRSAWRAICWLALALWEFEERYLKDKPPRPEVLPMSIEDLRARLDKNARDFKRLAEQSQGMKREEAFGTLQYMLALQAQEKAITEALSAAEARDRALLSAA